MKIVNRGIVAGLVSCILNSILVAGDSAPPLAVHGIEVIEQPLPYLVGGRLVRPARVSDERVPLWLMLSRDRYWAEDGHLGMVLELAPDDPFPGGEVMIRVVAPDGVVLGSSSLAAPGARFIVYPELPQPLLDGGDGRVEVEWRLDGEMRGAAAADFRVESFVAPGCADVVGRVAIHIPNPEHFAAVAIPFTVGVPLPRGVLYDVANVRLVDGSGGEIPVQVMETARWSRYGSLKWILCDFIAELNGGPMELFVEFGPAVQRSSATGEWVTEESSGFPVVDAGRLRFDDGLWWDADGSGEFSKILEAAAMDGGFVERVDGTLYQMSADGEWLIEEIGPRKTVVLRRGWYTAGGDD